MTINCFYIHSPTYRSVLFELEDVSCLYLLLEFSQCSICCKGWKPKLIISVGTESVVRIKGELGAKTYLIFSKAVLLLCILFVIYVSSISLLYYLVCSVQPCDHLLNTVLV